MDKEEALASLRDPQGSPGPAVASIQNRSRRRRLRVALWAGTALLVLAIAGAAYWLTGMRANGVPRVRILHIVAGGGANQGTVLSAAGYVVARRETTVSSRITGMIRAVYIQEGMHVKRGQVLARLHARTLRADVLLARRQVATDQTLVASARAQLALDLKNLERVSAIYRQGLESASALDSARAAVAVDRANLAHDLAQVAADRANLRLDRIALDHTVIRAPFSGMVTAKYAHRGEMISPEAVGGFTQTGICELVDMHSLEMDVDVNESFIDRVHAGQLARIVLNAYPNWRIPARVISIVPTANKDKGTVKVRVAFDRLNPKILPEMAGEVYFLTGQTRLRNPDTAITIPKHALHGAGSHRFVYLLEDGRVAKTRVRLLGSAGRGRVRIRGLSGGARLIVSSTQPLRDGERVRVRRHPRSSP